MTDYAAVGGSLFNNGYSLALQASATGTVTTQSLISGAMAIATGLDPATTQQIMAAVANVENAAAVGASWGSVLGPQGAAIGAIVGAVVGIMETLPWAHGDNTDSRPLIIQLWEKGIPPISSDLQIQSQATALSRLVSDRYAYLVNPTCDPNISVFCTRVGQLGADITNLFAQWDTNGAGLGSDALHRFDYWTLRPCNDIPTLYQGPGINVAIPTIGMPDVGMCAPGAVGQVSPESIYYGGHVDISEPAVLVWSDQQLYAYLIGLRLQLKKYEEAYSLTSDPTTQLIKARLNEIIGWVASKIPALTSDPNAPSRWGGGGAFTPPPLPNLVGSGTAPMSVGSKVALGIGGTAVAVAGGSWLYTHFVLHQAYGAFWSRVWSRTRSRAVKLLKR